MDTTLKISHVYDNRTATGFKSVSVSTSPSNLWKWTNLFNTFFFSLSAETSLTYPNVLIINIVNFTSSRLYISTLKFLCSLFSFVSLPWSQKKTKTSAWSCCLSPPSYQKVLSWKSKNLGLAIYLYGDS